MAWWGDGLVGKELVDLSSDPHHIKAGRGYIYIQYLERGCRSLRLLIILTELVRNHVLHKVKSSEEDTFMLTSGIH